MPPGRSACGAWSRSAGRCSRRGCSAGSTSSGGRSASSRSRAFGIVVLLVPLIPSVAAAAVGWGRVRDLLASDPSPWLVLAAIMTWVAVWLGGLVLVGVAAAARAAAWTLELPRSRAGDRHPAVPPGVTLARAEAPDSPATLPDAAPPSGTTPLR